MTSKCRILLLGLSLALSVEALAQLPSPSPTPTTQGPSQAGPAVAEDPLGRMTPYGTVVNFITAAERGDLTRAAEYLNSKQTSEHKQEMAQQLKRLMDVGLKVDLNSLSRSPDGYIDDGLPPTREKVGEIQIGEEDLEVFLDRVQRGDNPPLWLFAAETLLNLREFVKVDVEVPWLERHLPKSMIEKQLWGIALYRWISIPLSLLLILAIAWVSTWLLLYLIRHIFRPVIQKNIYLNQTSFVGPVRLLLFAFLMSLVARLGITLLIRQFWTHVATILFAVGAAWLFVRVVDLFSLGFAARLRRTGAQHRIAAVQLFRGIANTLAVITVLLIVLDFEGVNLTTAITGLGIGGVAIAFAAQKTIENLFGTVMLVIDQPVRVGDFCRVGDTLGTVENIGLRSTRIRTLDRTVVSVPNGQVASLVLENFAPRDKIWFRHTIGLRYETTADQLRLVLANIRKLLYEHPGVENASARIRFVKFGGSSLDLEIFAYVFATDYGVFLEIQEDLLLRIMDIIEASGTGVAFPSQTTYLAKDSGLDADKTKVAIAQVQQWKQDKTLPFPNFPPETISEVQDTLEYPPPDSALREQK